MSQRNCRCSCLPFFGLAECHTPRVIYFFNAAICFVLIGSWFGSCCLSDFFVLVSCVFSSFGCFWLNV